jgi:hypothetical protein
MRLLQSRRVPWTGDLHLLEDYFSRFFAKFVEILAISFATACSAYLIAHFMGPPPAAMPTPAAVSVGSATATAVEAPKNPPAQPAPPVAAAAVEEQRPAPRPVTDGPAAQPAVKAAKAATSSAPSAPVSKDVKTSTGAARGEKSAEALARAALANLDADRTSPPEAPIRRASTSTSPVAAAPVEVVPRPSDLPPPPPRPAEMQPPPAAAEAPPRHVATVDPLAPDVGAPLEIAAPRSETPAEEAKGLFALPKRVFGLLRPGTPSTAGEAPPRPPLPVGTAAPE